MPDGVEISVSKLNLELNISAPLPLDEIGDISIGSAVKGWENPHSTKTFGWQKLHSYFDEIRAEADVRKRIIEELKPFAGLKFSELVDRVKKWSEYPEIKAESAPILKALFAV